MRHYISFNNVRLLSHVFTTEYPQSEWLKHDESIFSDFEILTVTPRSDPLPTYKMLAPFDGIFYMYVQYPSKFVFCAYYNYTQARIQEFSSGGVQPSEKKNDKKGRGKGVGFSIYSA